ncbi:hypothetical protein Cgig2_020480 [Carnegiea gigantea]|uniref:Uncharacterized protein n=1 Tax=Carnegiea gigantea TaxID=171969 RepID=A0A9Q1GFQ7_9CARY|nr:hypothetical protein Cgig2_020480 [Carnegiea gigantea]
MMKATDWGFEDARAQREVVEAGEGQIQEISNTTVQATNEPERGSPTSPVAAISPNRGAISSYAAMTTDPDEGTSLKFIQTPVINSVKCARIVSNDVNPEIEYWKSVVLCFASGLIHHWSYSVNTVSMSDQFIHYKITQIHTMKRFFITFVYEANQEMQRRGLWEDLKYIANDMKEAMCILGDFKTVLYSGDRLGGTEV